MALTVILLILPIILGGLVCYGFSIVDNSRWAVRGVAGPYFAAVALLFGLFGSLITSEAWQKAGRFNTLVITEISSLRALLRIADAVSPAATSVRGAVAKYLEDVGRSEFAPSRPESSVPEVLASINEFYGFARDPGHFRDEPAFASEFLDEVERIRAARFERLEIRKSHIPWEKFAILFVFGLLTQISIALCHAGNPRAIVATVMLFSLAFSVTVGTISVIDDPFSAHLINAAVLGDVK